MRTTAFDRPMPEALARLRAAMLAAGDPEGLLMTPLNTADPMPYLLAHSKRVKQLDRMPLASLRAIWRQAQTDAGVIQIWNGPLSKDEFVNGIVEIEFPEVAAA